MVSVSLALWLVGCAPELNWRQVPLGGNGSASMLFPCKVSRQQRQIDVVGSTRSVTLQVCDAAGVTWAATQVSVQDANDASAVAASLAATVAANLGAGLGAGADPARQSSAPAVTGADAAPAPLSLRLSGRAQDGGARDAAIWILAHDRRVLQLTALGAAALPAEAVDIFFQSLRLAR